MELLEKVNLKLSLDYKKLFKTFIAACHRVAPSILSKSLSNIEWRFPGRLELTERSDMHHRVLPHCAICTRCRRLWRGAGIVQQFSDILKGSLTNSRLLTSPYCEKPETTHFPRVENHKSHGTISTSF